LHSYGAASRLNNRKNLKEKKADRITSAIANAGESANMKAITQNKLKAKRKGKRLENPHLP
jgi:hypothetical protein